MSDNSKGGERFYRLATLPFTLGFLIAVAV